MRKSTKYTVAAAAGVAALLLMGETARAQRGITFGAKLHASYADALAEELPLPGQCTNSSGQNTCRATVIQEGGSYRRGPWIPWHCDPPAANTVICHVNLPGGQDEGAVTSHTPWYSSLAEARKHALPVPAECINSGGRNQCVEEIIGMGESPTNARWQLGVWIWRWSADCRSNDGSPVDCSTPDSYPALPAEARLWPRYPVQR